MFGIQFCTRAIQTAMPVVDKKGAGSCLSGPKIITLHQKTYIHNGFTTRQQDAPPAHDALHTADARGRLAPPAWRGDDGFKYVVKMRGAGHGAKALTAELIGGETARAAGLRVPEFVTLDIDEAFGRTEPDPEIQDLLKASTGINLGLHFLNGAITLDPWSNPVDAAEASRIVWLDAFLTNVDRTPRNTNMLVWHNETWLIDHGATLYFHHSMTDPAKAGLASDLDGAFDRIMQEQVKS